MASRWPAPDPKLVDPQRAAFVDAVWQRLEEQSRFAKHQDGREQAFNRGEYPK